MFALIDGNSFYASCEKVFDPSIRNKPVVVLTNNDGCVCAACKIAKSMGYKSSFEPYFKSKKQLDAMGAVVRSSNYELYGDLSQRMMAVCEGYGDEHHVYSIDELFLRFHNKSNWLELGREIRNQVWKQVKLPVAAGFGPTPTLAKAANHAGKRLPGFNNVAVIDNESSRQDILRQMEPGKVWGVGRRIERRLLEQGIDSAWKLSCMQPKHARKFHSVVLEKTVRELNGEHCLDWDAERQPKKEIFSTRSFGTRVTDSAELAAALCTHAAVVAEKLRKQNSVVKTLQVFAASSPFDENYVRRSHIYQFTVPTCDTRNIIKAVMALFPQIFVEGAQFYRCGVGLIELHGHSPTQLDLFNSSSDSPELMHCLDSTNGRYGPGSMKIAAMGVKKPWEMTQAYLSKRATTRWHELPVIQC